jgi:hypothetical protein
LTIFTTALTLAMGLGVAMTAGGPPGWPARPVSPAPRARAALPEAA